jgi:hypothetical protein
MPLPELLKRQLGQSDVGKKIIKIVESNKNKGKTPSSHPEEVAGPPAPSSGGSSSGGGSSRRSRSSGGGGRSRRSSSSSSNSSSSNKSSKDTFVGPPAPSGDTSSKPVPGLGQSGTIPGLPEHLQPRNVAKAGTGSSQSSSGDGGTFGTPSSGSSVKTQSSPQQSSTMDTLHQMGFLTPQEKFMKKMQEDTGIAPTHPGKGEASTTSQDKGYTGKLSETGPNLFGSVLGTGITPDTKKDDIVGQGWGETTEVPSTTGPGTTQKGTGREVDPELFTRALTPIEQSLYGGKDSPIADLVYQKRMQEDAIQDTTEKTQEYVDENTINKGVDPNQTATVTWEDEEGEKHRVRTNSISSLQKELEDRNARILEIEQSYETVYKTPTTEQIENFQQQTFQDEYKQVQRLNKPKNLSQDAWNTLEQQYRTGQISSEQFQQQVETETRTQQKPDYYEFVPKNQYRTVIKRLNEGQYTEEEAADMLDKLNKQGMKNAPQHRVNEWAKTHFRFGEEGEKTFEELKREDPALQGITYDPEKPKEK